MNFCTAYVKLKEKHILFESFFFIFDIFLIKKNRSQKLSMLEEKQGPFGICIDFRAKQRSDIFNFFLLFFSILKKLKFCLKISHHQKNKTKIENITL